jgi:hypothetical protein
MKAQELGAAYKRSELQGDDKHVSNSATVTKISSDRKEMVRTMPELNVFKSEGQLRYEATDHNEYAKQKPTLEINCDDGQQVEKAITEEVNRDTKESAVMEHKETQKMVKTNEISANVPNKEHASAAQIQRYINSSLEMQIINQDNLMLSKKECDA